MKTEAVNNVFRALAHPDRRQAIDLLTATPGMTVNELTEHFAVSRYAIMKHLKILEEGGLLRYKREGRTKRLFIELRPLQNAYNTWFAQHATPGPDAEEQRLEEERLAQEQTAEEIDRLLGQPVVPPAAELEPEPVVVAPPPAPEPVVAAPEPAPEPVVAAPEPEPGPEPVVVAPPPPEPEPEPEPVVAAPAPEPEPVAAAPEPEPEPEPVVAEPAPTPPPVVAIPEPEPTPPPAAVPPPTPDPQPEAPDSLA